MADSDCGIILYIMAFLHPNTKSGVKTYNIIKSSMNIIAVENIIQQTLKLLAEETLFTSHKIT